MPFYFHRRFLCLFVLILLGLIRGIFWKPSCPPLPYFDRRVDLCGTVGSPSEKKAQGISLILEKLIIHNKPTLGKLVIFIRWRDLNLKRLESSRGFVGRRVCFSSTIQSIQNFGISGEFDLERYFLAKKIWGRAFPQKKDSIRIEEGESFYPIQKARERFSIYLDQFSEGKILKALVLGIQADLPRNVREDFMKSGSIHLLVISGQNIAFLLLFLFSFFNWLGVKSEYLLLHYSFQKVTIALSSFILFLFYIFSGGDIPVLRATMMAFSSLATLWYSRSQNGFYGLGMALAIILNFIPSSLFDPSFQLSFFAVTGGMVLPVLFRDRWKTIQSHFFWLLAMTTLAVTVSTAPLILYHFHRLTLISFLSNFILVPFVSCVLLPLSFVITSFYFLYSPMASFLMIFFSPLSHIFTDTAHLFALLPGAALFFVPPSFVQMLVLYTTIILISIFISRKEFKKAIGLFCGCVFFFSISFFLSQEFQKREADLKISFLSVGQGDASLLELPHGKTVLIDAGGLWGQFDVGERLIAPYLWKKGIRKINTMIMSHSDFDHIQGFHFILEHFDVGEIWISQYQGNTYFYRILELVEKRGIPVILFSRGTAPKVIEGVNFYFLNPLTNFSRVKNNDVSLVIKCMYKNFSVLFTGDIEKGVEKVLSLNEFPSTLRSTLLKVPHHGSKTSSSLFFLNRVSPKLAVISVGKYNRYRHPNESVLQRYRELSIPLWRTDLQGTLEITTNGDAYW